MRKFNRYTFLIFFLGFGFMMYQLSVLRELRFQLSLSYPLIPLFFGIVFFIVGLGALSTKFFKSKEEGALNILLFALPFLSIISFFFLLKTSQFVYPNQPGVGKSYNSVYFYFIDVIKAMFITAGGSFGIIHLIQGMLFGLLYKIGRDNKVLSKFYASDLFSLGVGSLIAAGISFFVSPINCIFLASFLFSACGPLSGRLLRHKFIINTAAFIFILTLFILEVSCGWLTDIETPNSLKENLTMSLWTPYQRIDIVGDENKIDVYADRFYYYSINSSPLARYYLKDEVPFNLIDDSSRVLVIGSGLGRDIRNIRNFSSRNCDITAVELDKGDDTIN